MIALKPCPFCGCSMEILESNYPNGDKKIEPHGWHDDGCPLGEVLWCLYDEDGWTPEKIAESWNRRWEES